MGSGRYSERTMRSLVWIGAIALLVSCSRDNPLFDLSGGGASGSDGMTGPGGPMSDTRGPDSGMLSADGGSAGVTSAPPPTTGGPGGNTDSTPPTTLTRGETSPPDDTGPPGGCCEVHGGSGCDEFAVQECVCDVNEGCCDTEWTQDCVDLVDLLGCGSGCGADLDQCCSVGGPCEIQFLEDCVCLTNPVECCDGWSFLCVLHATNDCYLEVCDVPSNNCCFPNKLKGPGCSDIDVAYCVCVESGAPECCTGTWDQSCVDVAMAFCEPGC